MAKEIAHRWATDELLPETKILFLLYLRDPQLQSVSKIQQLIQYISNECLNIEQITTFTTHLANTRGQQLCIVMDGFDEYPPSLQENSFIANIINRLVLPETIVVITSRPTATVLLHDRVDRRIDILGLPKEEKENYISKLFTNLPEKKVQLIKYLKQQPVINGLCSVPLHLTILSYLFEQGSLPETLTEMNESFILHTIYRHLKRYSLTPSSPIYKLVNVPKPVLNIVYNLSELAFKGLQENKLVFTFDEIKQICPCIDEIVGAINGFGLLQVVEHYPHKGAGTTKSFNFLHYTMQEFLAALHVSTLPSEQQSSLMERSFWDIYCSLMWVMFVGIVGIESDIFSNFLSKEEVFKRKSQVRIQIPYYLENDKRKLLHVFQCFIEARSNEKLPDVISDMFNDGKVCLSGVKLFPHHILALTTFISNSFMQYHTLDLSWCMLTDIEMNEIQQCICVSDKLSTLEHVNLSCNDSSPWGVYCAIIRHGNVTCLTLHGDTYGYYGLQDYVIEITESLQKNTKLQSLTLTDMRATKEEIRAIFAGIQTTKTLKTLKISGNKISDYEAETIGDGLKNNNSLQELDISDNKITSEGAIKIAEAIKVNTTLKVLNINHNKISDDGVDAISDSLKSNNLLQELYMGYNEITSEGAIKIAEAITVNTTLKVLNINNNTFDNGADAISNSLKSNKSLQELNMSYNRIYSSGVIKIAEAIKVNTTLKVLNINGNTTSDKGADAISDSLKSNNSLQELNMSNNWIYSWGAIKIAEAIKVNTTLKILNINGNTISDDGVAAISDSLKSNNSLQELYMECNNITSKGAKMIAEAIKVNTTLKVLSIKNNTISDDGVDAISDSLKSNNSLQELNMDNNKITSEGAKKIAEAIKVNTTLHTLAIRQHNINDALSFNMTVLNAVYHNNTLMKLCLPSVYDDNYMLVSSEVEKINKERTRQGISILTCHY